MPGREASEHLRLISVLQLNQDSRFLKVETRFGFPTGLSIGQRQTECLLSKLSEEVHPDYLACENQYWGKRKCLCSDKACVLDSGCRPWARGKKWGDGPQSGAPNRG